MGISCLTSDTNPYLATSFTCTFCLILSDRVCVAASMIFQTRFSASALVSPLSRTSSTRCLPNSTARIATYSTCANFCPTHDRWPSPNGAQAPFFATCTFGNVSPFTPGAAGDRAGISGDGGFCPSQIQGWKFAAFGPQASVL